MDNQLKNSASSMGCTRLHERACAIFDNTITYNQFMVAAMVTSQKAEGEAMEGKGVTQVKTKPVTLDENPSKLNNMKKQLAVLKSMVSKNANVGRQKGGPQGRNNKGNVINLDLSLRANPPITTAQGLFQDGKLPVQCHKCRGWGPYLLSNLVKLQVGVEGRDTSSQQLENNQAARNCGEQPDNLRAKEAKTPPSLSPSPRVWGWK